MTSPEPGKTETAGGAADGGDAAKVEPSRTFHASQAIQLSELITIKFSSQRFGSNTPRIIKVNEPEGPSTDGGRKARQSMVLAPERGDGAALVFGWLDGPRKIAELKTYASVAENFRTRYGMAIDIPKTEYDRLIREMQDFLKTQAIDSTMTDVHHGKAPDLAEIAGATQESGTSRLMLFLFVGLVLGFGLCYLLVKAMS